MGPRYFVGRFGRGSALTGYTTKIKIPYALPGDKPASYPATSQEIANKLDTLLQAVPVVLQGSVSMSLNNETKSVAVTYSKAFVGAVPYPMVTPNTSVPQNVAGSALSPTLTGFVLYGYRSSSSTTTFTWLAVGKGY